MTFHASRSHAHVSRSGILPSRTTAGLLLLAAAMMAGTSLVHAQEVSQILTIRDHRFEPSTITVKSGVKVKLTITNAQKAAAEFESNELNREKVIPPGSTGVVYIGPLEAGTYKFFDDFHPATTGRIVAK